MNIISFIAIRQLKNISFPSRSTIFALSTPPGKSAIAVIRVSGPNANEVLYRIGRCNELPSPRKALLRNIRDPENGNCLDKAVILWFPSPRSSTGEDVCELHIHGGSAVIKSVLKALGKLPMFRHAQPGEFTKRAFIGGKLDLTEVEGLADLLHAETEAQQRQALRQMEGVLLKLYDNWTERIKKCLANMEAYIDFSEDNNIECPILKTVMEEVKKIQREIEEHLLDDHRGERLREGIGAVLIGKPNVGKSSLLNAICKREVAIVSSSEGTTRDIIESAVNLGGYLVRLSDTAGIRSSQNTVEQEGVRRAYKKSSEADILLFIVEAKTAIDYMSKYEELCSENLINYLMNTELGGDFTTSFEIIHKPLEKTMQILNTDGRKMEVLLVLNKIDLLSREDMLKIETLENELKVAYPISCHTGRGINTVLSVLLEKVENMCSYTEHPVLTQARHRKYLENSLSDLGVYNSLLECDSALAVEKLRNVLTELGKITGKVTTEELLDTIFKDFCIGK